ncbi:AraC family transcriptional regulator [Acerihabitans sp. TG2]|uniref:AraC family transcriptional regulator n=1 Tax=Acerihabitans sp. TG2 TaxID=3096008 RepID=UPI002B238C71|nr:AraC family transcriptional regulator [Acerihabitans sp. TG2]MEA9390276.1 AraC family transcriptional regulator [Acerihabitans sp. TG2]
MNQEFRLQRPLDPLSDILSLLSAKCMLSSSLRASGSWKVSLPSEALKFNVILSGECFLLPATSHEPLHLKTGDCFLMNSSGPYLLYSDPMAEIMGAQIAFPDGPHGSLLHGGDEFMAIGCRIALDKNDAALLLDNLPSLHRIPSHRREASGISWLLTRLAAEWNSSAPGSTAATDHLAQLLFVEIIRSWLRSADAPITGWLNALSDRRIGEAIRQIHNTPERQWLVGELAKVVGMSRSNFALRFKQMVGLPPLDYLLRWRIRLAAKALRSTADPLSDISLSLGYQAESTFSYAFKRIVGISPKKYRLMHQQTQDGR